MAFRNKIQNNQFSVQKHLRCMPQFILACYHRSFSKIHLQHVLDSSAPDLEEHRSTVLHVLQQIGVSEDKIQNMIEVWNKVCIFLRLEAVFYLNLCFV